MVKIREAIVVEGRYDKNTLSQVVDAPIFETNGFGIRKDKARMDLLRRVPFHQSLPPLPAGLLPLFPQQYQIYLWANQ